jgi:hypothetical protein
LAWEQIVKRHLHSFVSFLLLLSAFGAALVANVGPAAAQARNCGELRQEYAGAIPPKAWAESAATGKCAFASARSEPTLAAAKSRALGDCAAAGGIKCRVTAAAGR